VPELRVEELLKNVFRHNIADTDWQHCLRANAPRFISERTDKYGFLYP
jgi:hypothetical protein